jgi:hypothetical protein
MRHDSGLNSAVEKRAREEDPYTLHLGSGSG